MKASFIIPVYKTEAYLPFAIESILSQGLSDYEIILVDDGSPDNSGAICDDYSARYPFIKTVHKENGGPGYARNSGLDVAQGDYVFFLDSDDFYETGTLKDLFDFITDEDIVIFDENLHFPNKVVGCSDEIYRIGTGEFTTDGFLEKLCTLPKFTASAYTKAYRRKFLENNALRFPPYVRSEDLEFAVSAVISAKKLSAYGGAVYAYRRQMEGTRSNTLMPECIKAMFRFIEQPLLKEKELSEQEKRYVDFCRAYEYTIAVLRYSSTEKEFRKEIKPLYKKYFYLLGRAKGSRYTLIRICSKIFGFYITSKLINIYIGGR